MQALRPLFLILGFAFVALGYVGVLIPGMPSFVFFLLALWAFERSSPKFEDWLLNKSPIGPTLKDWRQNRTVRPRTKVVAISVLWGTMATSAALILYRNKPPWILAVMAVIGVCVTWYIATRPSGQDAVSVNEAA